MYPRSVLSKSNEKYLRRLQEGKPVLPKCRVCGRLFFYPRLLCPHCHSDLLSLTPPNGPFTLLSFTFVYRPQARVFEEHVPILLIAADYKGATIIAEGKGWSSSSPRIGEEVLLVPSRREDSSVVPIFVPISSDVTDPSGHSGGLKGG